MTKPKNPQRRRAFFLLGGLAAFAGLTRIVPRWLDKLDSQFDFTELDAPQGFRALERGDVSTVVDPFVGLGGAEDDIPDVSIADLETALFYGRTGSDRVQIAYFSDLYCPYCRVLSSQIIELAQSDAIDVSWQDRPIFGPASILAAKGQIAAGRQGAYEDFHAALSATPIQVTRPFLVQLAGRLDLDVAQFQSDFDSGDVLQNLGRARALADQFGFVGTPAMVVGRTVVEGRISPTNLEQLIELERAAL